MEVGIRRDIGIFKHFDVASLRQNPQIAYYFRYPLYHSDFHQLRDHQRLVGYVAAKPLYGKLTPAGRVDKSGGFNGQIAVIFVPSPARSARRAILLLTELPRDQITTPLGRRNWSAIRVAADQAVLEQLKRSA